MTRTDATAVRRQVVVNAPQAKAFAVFTERIGDFKPPEHNLLAVPIAETVLEPRAAGIIDRGGRKRVPVGAHSGLRTADLLVFSWDIGPTWQIETDPEQTSEVEVRFVAEGPDRPGSNSSIGTSIGTVPVGGRSPTASTGMQGWPLYLGRYGALLGQES